MNPQVVVTRAQPGADETAQRLRQLGYEPIVSPVLTLTACTPPPDLDLPGVAGFIFTSANGVRFFAEQSAERSIRAWCVGRSTLAAAEAAGFADTVSADGDAADLAALIDSEADPQAGPLLHVANAAAAGALAARLRAAGFTVAFAALYEARPAARLEPAAAAAIARGAATLVHSAKGASALMAVLGDGAFEDIPIVAISEQAAAPLRKAGVGSVAIASRPNEDALLAALAEAFPVF